LVVKNQVIPIKQRIGTATYQAPQLFLILGLVFADLWRRRGKLSKPFSTIDLLAN
jgi:hypothetical protein